MAFMSFYNYIDEIPFYIHNTGNNFLETGKDIYKTVKDVSYLEDEYIKKILQIQQKREDDILIQLFGSKDVDITKEFENYGFILTSELTAKVIKEVDSLKNDVDKIKKIQENLSISSKNNIDLSNILKEIDNLWDEYQKKITEVEKNIDSALKIINAGLESDLPSLASNLEKLREFKQKKNQSVQEVQIEELRKLNGKISNFYQDITEGFRRKDIKEIKEEIKDKEFSVIKEADSYRSLLSNMTTLAKADMIIIKKEKEVIIPLGGVSVKKTDSTTKFHNTTSITAFLNLLKKGSFVDKTETQHDSNILQYLMINRLIHQGSIYKAATESIRKIATKYGLLWLAGEITKEVLNKEDTNEAVKLLMTNEIFNSEHADFLYSFSSKTGLNKVTRMSEELKKQYKKNFGFGISFPDKELGDFAIEEILDSLSGIKKQISPYTYEKAINNRLLIGKMKSIYGQIGNGLDIRITK